MKYKPKYLLYHYNGHSGFIQNEIIQLDAYNCKLQNTYNTYLDTIIEDLKYKYIIKYCLKNEDNLEIDLQKILDDFIFTDIDNCNVHNSIFYIYIQNNNKIKYLYSSKNIDKLYDTGIKNKFKVLSIEEYIIKNIIE